MTTWPGWHAAPPLEWMRTIRDGVDLGKSTKSVAFCLALHATPKGDNARPGWKRLAWESGTSRRTVIASLGELEGCGLLYCVERGSSFGQRERASNYTLTLHDALAEITTTYERWLIYNDLAPTRPSAAPPAASSQASDPWA